MADDELRALLEAMRKENASAHAETRRHFDVVAERMEKRIDGVAESLAALDEKVERKAEDLDERMRRGFEETQAMIRFSHAELDRRVRTLEQALADLRARVERLETTTH